MQIPDSLLQCLHQFLNSPELSGTGTVVSIISSTIAAVSVLRSRRPPFHLSTEKAVSLTTNNSKRIQNKTTLQKKIWLLSDINQISDSNTASHLPFLSSYLKKISLALIEIILQSTLTAILKKGLILPILNDCNFQNPL